MRPLELHWQNQIMKESPGKLADMGRAPSVLLLVLAFLPVLVSAGSKGRTAGLGRFSSASTWTPSGVPLADEDVIIDASESCDFMTVSSRMTHEVDVPTAVLGNVLVDSVRKCPALVQITGELRATSMTIRGPVVVLLDGPATRLTVLGSLVVEAPAVLMGAGTVTAERIDVGGDLVAGASLAGACPACRPLSTQKMGRLSFVGVATITGRMFAKLDSCPFFYDAV